MKKLVLFALIAAFAHTAHAKTQAPQQCDGSTAEMIDCMMKQNDAQEKIIQNETQKLIQTLEVGKKNEPEGAQAYELAKKAIVDANQKFAEAANLQCQVEGTLETATGSLGRIVTASCILRLTSARAQELIKLNTEAQQ